MKVYYFRPTGLMAWQLCGAIQYISSGISQQFRIIVLEKLFGISTFVKCPFFCTNENQAPTRVCSSNRHRAPSRWDNSIEDRYSSILVRNIHFFQKLASVDIPDTNLPVVPASNKQMVVRGMSYENKCGFTMGANVVHQLSCGRIKYFDALVKKLDKIYVFRRVPLPPALHRLRGDQKGIITTPRTVIKGRPSQKIVTSCSLTSTPNRSGRHRTLDIHGVGGTSCIPCASVHICDAEHSLKGRHIKVRLTRVKRRLRKVCSLCAFFSTAKP
mmetsp:Transcript_10368/g.18295  ORF Transcript_10368/g.18295 Transcript_10368/m.18295 type:complete len:271 (-) Transcript_10368:242-1054(-)